MKRVILLVLAVLANSTFAETSKVPVIWNRVALEVSYQTSDGNWQTYDTRVLDTQFKSEAAAGTGRPSFQIQFEPKFSDDGNTFQMLRNVSAWCAGSTERVVAVLDRYSGTWQDTLLCDKTTWRFALKPL